METFFTTELCTNVLKSDVFVSFFSLTNIFQEYIEMAHTLLNSYIARHTEHETTKKRNKMTKEANRKRCSFQNTDNVYCCFQGE